MTQEVRVEQLLGKLVVDIQGEKVGRIQEIRAEQQGQDWIVAEYLVGLAAVLERSSAWAIGRSIFTLFGSREAGQGFRVAWNQLDLTQIDHPRLTCTIADLKPLDEQHQAEQH